MQPINLQPALTGNTLTLRPLEKLGAALSQEQDREFKGKPYVQLYCRLEEPQYSANRLYRTQAPFPAKPDKR